MQRSADLGDQLSNGDNVRRPVYQLWIQLTEAVTCLTDISQNSWLCYYCVLLCTLRWIDSAFSLTKSLGMHTGAGSGNSNTALSWAVKGNNTSCPLWTGLANTQIPIFGRKTLPVRHFTDKSFNVFFPQSGLRWYEGTRVSAWVTPVESSHCSHSRIMSYFISGVLIQW